METTPPQSEALRQTLDAAFKQLSSAFEAANAAKESDHSKLLQRLTSATEGYAQAQKEIEDLRAELQHQIEEKQRFDGSIAKLQADCSALRETIDAEKQLTAAARKECDDAHQALLAAEAARVRAQTMGADENRARTAAEQELKQARQALAAAEAARARAQTTSADENQARMAADRELEQVRQELEHARAELAQVATDHEAEAAAHQKMAAELSATAQQLHAAEEQRQRIAALLEASNTRLAALKQASTKHQATSRELEAKLEAAVADERQARERADAAAKECDRWRRQAESAAEAVSASQHDESSDDVIRFDRTQAYDHATAFVALSLDRLLAVNHSLSTGRTVDDVLDALVTILGNEFTRVALFSVKPSHLESVRQVGFDPSMNMSHVAIPRAMDSLLARSVVSGRIEVLSGRELSEASDMPFGGAPGTVLALPIALDDEPLAVVYADDAGQPHRELVSPELRMKFAALVREQAAPVLARIAGERKALADLDEYAAVLVKHLQSTHAADVRSGMQAAERCKRLTQNLEYAQRLYMQHARGHGSRGAAVLDDRLEAMVNVRPATSFARDLATVMGRPLVQAETSQRPAEASR